MLAAEVVAIPVEDKLPLDDVVVVKVVLEMLGVAERPEELVAPTIVDPDATVLDTESEVFVILVAPVAVMPFVNEVLLLVNVICGIEPPGTVHGIGVCVAIEAVEKEFGVVMIVVVKVIVIKIGIGMRLSSSTTPSSSKFL